MDPKKTTVSTSHAAYGLIILLLINSVNYMDRYVVSILLPLIKSDLALSDTELGLIGGVAFTVFYAVMALPMGWAVDRFIRKYVLTFGIFIWSLATAFSGLASSFSTFFIARAFTGTGESSAHPSGVSLIGDYFSQKVRTIAIALFQIGVPIGAGLGIILGGILAKNLGWRSTFYIYAIPGILLIPFILFMKEPVRGSSEGLSIDKKARAGFAGFINTVIKILSSKTLIYHYAATALIMFGSQGFNFWLPTYLNRVRGFELEAAGKIAGIGMLVGGFVGALGGAIVADVWFRKNKKARLLVQTWAALLTVPFMLLTLLTTSTPIMITSIFFAIILFVAMFPILSAIIADLVEPGDRGVGMALLLLLQTGIGFSLGPLVVGAISDASGSLVSGLFVLPIASILVFILGILGLRHILEDYERVMARTGRASR